MTDFVRNEGLLATITGDWLGDSGTVFASAGGSREVKDPLPPPGIVLMPEHYNRSSRLIEKGIPVKLESKFRPASTSRRRTASTSSREIPGTEQEGRSGHAGRALRLLARRHRRHRQRAGAAVAMEAARILKALKLPLSRTVRMAFWAGEEAGPARLARVREASTSPTARRWLKPEHAKLAGYFNYDNGAGKIRGVYLQGNDMVRPIFEAWLEPFKDLGAATITIRNTGGTDHLAFDAVGLARLPVHPGPAGVRHPHAPLEHGRLRRACSPAT